MATYEVSQQSIVNHVVITAPTLKHRHRVSHPWAYMRVLCKTGKVTTSSEPSELRILAHQMRGKHVLVTLKSGDNMNKKFTGSSTDLEKQGVLLEVDPDSGNLILLHVCEYLRVCSTCYCFILHTCLCAQ